MSRLASCWLTMMGAALLTGCGPAAPVSSESNKQPATPSSSRSDGTRGISIVTSSGVEMVQLPDGEFTMGSEMGEADEAPLHKVRVSAFQIDKFEVTHELFKKAQLPNPSRWQDAAGKPIERVRWRDAKQYCNERSLLEGLKPCYDEKSMDWNCDYAADGYRLPTEAEWEYAAGGGGDTANNVLTPDRLRQYGWFAGNADQKTHPVGQKKPNGWGLFDMHGNVSEWCEDVYDPGYYRSASAQDPRGPAGSGKDLKRVIRGGSWKSSAAACRAQARQGEVTGDSDACFSTDYCGFRCVRRAGVAPSAPATNRPG
ncbi:MAG: hypothetical protein QOF48_3842 [Verrucomicrobiota bacterium]|jgi:formylglycine-generating enzyme required for sulfatase activity